MEVRQPIKTDQLWQWAATRALAGDLTSDLIRRRDSVLVPSTTTDGKRYRVQLTGNRVGACDCPAGVLGNPCKHRMAVVIRMWEREHGVRVVAVKPAAVPAMLRYLRD